jgi:hypothetical protein
MFNIESCLLSSKRPKLNIYLRTVKDVNGDSVKVNGQIETNIKMGGKVFNQSLIVCEMLPDGIIDQDFLMKKCDNT